MSILLTDFARNRLFPREPRRNTIQDCTREQFERRLNEVPPLEVLDGYAPFCKLHVHRNWTSTRCLAVRITDETKGSEEVRVDFFASARIPLSTSAGSRSWPGPTR